MPTLFYEDRRVADVQATPDGPVLTYDAAWLADAQAFPASLSMPLTQADWPSETATPWLANLLPEGEPLRAVTRALGVAQEDILAMIGRMGRDVAGALQLETPRADGPGTYRVVETGADLARIIGELPSRPFLVGEDGVSMSLAGAQEKLPVAVVDDRIAIPVNGAASTHILKPDNPHLPGSVQNEALCMILAARCGLNVAEVVTGTAQQRSYCLVTRYDRETGPNGPRRLHQEDFCQALGRPPSAKYEHNQTGRRGPSLAEMFALTRQHMTAVDINRLLDAVIFNIAVGNVDSHAKNYSILLAPQSVTLAPLYDLMSGLSWANITQNHAQDIGGQNRGRHITARHWRALAQDCGLARAATVRRVIALTDRILAALPTARDAVAAMPAGADPLLNVFVDDIAERVALVQANARRDD